MFLAAVSLGLFNPSTCLAHPYEYISGHLYFSKEFGNSYIEFCAEDRSTNLDNKSKLYSKIKSSRFFCESSSCTFRLEVQILKCIKMDVSREFGTRLTFVLNDGAVVSPYVRLNHEKDFKKIMRIISREDATVKPINDFMYVVNVDCDHSGWQTKADLDDDRLACLSTESASSISCVTASDDEFEIIYVVPKMKSMESEMKSEVEEPLSEEDWNEYVEPTTGRIIKYELLQKQIFKRGLKHELRQKAWMFLLGVYPWRSTADDRKRIDEINLEKYERLKEKWKTQLNENGADENSDVYEQNSLIRKDVIRTDRSLEFFNEDNNILILYEILMCYSTFNGQLGYVQGMSDLVAILYYVLRSDFRAFWCFVHLMNKIGGRFMPDHEAVHDFLKNLRRIIQYRDTDFFQYLRRQSSHDMLFCFRWLMVLFKREFCYNDTMTLWEALLSNTYSEYFDLYVCAAILLNERNVIMKCQFGYVEILKYMSSLSFKISLNNMLKKAEELFLYFKGLPENHIRTLK